MFQHVSSFIVMRCDFLLTATQWPHVFAANLTKDPRMDHEAMPVQRSVWVSVCACRYIAPMVQSLVFVWQDSQSHMDMHMCVFFSVCDWFCILQSRRLRLVMGEGLCLRCSSVKRFSWCHVCFQQSPTPWRIFCKTFGDSMLLKACLQLLSMLWTRDSVYCTLRLDDSYSAVCTFRNSVTDITAPCTIDPNCMMWARWFQHRTHRIMRNTEPMHTFYHPMHVRMDSRCWKGRKSLPTHGYICMIFAPQTTWDAPDKSLQINALRRPRALDCGWQFDSHSNPHLDNHVLWFGIKSTDMGALFNPSCQQI